MGILVQCKLSPSQIILWECAIYWHLTSIQKSEIPQSIKESFKLSEEFPDMQIDLNSYITPIISSHIKTITAKSSNELQAWTDVAITTFGCSENGFKDFLGLL